MPNDIKNFAGKDGFVWWMGIVEDRKDPLKLGRCKVRCVGWHSDNKMQLPTKALPWAMSVYPVNNQNSYAPKEGEMVFGFFVDGEQGQHPVILGSFPRIPLVAPNSQTAFFDNRSKSDLSASPKKLTSKTYKTDGSGITLSEGKASLYPDQLDEPSTSRIARNDSDTIKKTFIQERKDNKVSGVKTVTGSWDEPETKYGTVYPFNQVMETESGHLTEFDDTPGKERIHIAHRTGTFFEIYPDGSKVEKIVKNNYQIIMSDDNIYVMGKCNITVQGDAEIYVQKDVNLKVDGKITGTIIDSVNLTSPTFNLVGDVNVTGKITATDDIKSFKKIIDKTRSMQGDRDLYNIHQHAGTPPPNPQQ